MLIRLFDGTVEQLQRGIVFANRRHEVLAKNIANLDTPGYRTQDLVFADALNPAQAGAAPGLPVALSATDPSAPPARLVAAGDGAPNASGNDVSLDRQMARVSENTLFQHALVQILAGQFATLKQAISGRV